MRDERIIEVLERTRVVYESALDLESALQVFVDALVPDFADLVSIVTFEEWYQDDTVLVHVPAQAWVEAESAAASLQLQQAMGSRRWRGEALMRQLTKTHPVLVSDCPDMTDLVEIRDDEHRRLLEQVQARSMLAIPLLRGGEAIGSMVFGCTDRSGRHFTDDDLEPAREIALRCTAILETHRLRSALEEALTESERHRQRLERLLETMPEGFSLISRDLRYLQVNRTFARSQGVEPEDMVGRPITEFLGPGEDEAVDIVRHVVASGETVLGRELVSQPPGRSASGPRHVLVDLYPVAEGGEIVAVAALLRDITDRVRAEHRRVELEAELGRSRRLETVGRLAGGVAHDFNNILSVVQLRTELMLRQRPGDDELRQSLETVERAVDQGRELANQLLRFARPEQVPPDVVDVDRLLADLDPLLRALVGDEIIFELCLSDGGPSVLIERAGLQQAILNLVVNARDAMPGGGSVAVATGVQQLDGREGRVVRVTDTGSGMDAATRDRAFEPFFSTKPAGMGSGLGLATVYGTVRSGAGSVWIESEPGEGCSVVMWLPAVSGEPEPVADGPELRTGAGQPILVVEDQGDVAEAVVEMLDELGYRAMVASTGEAALAVVSAAGEVALVITDVVMPGLSGPDLADELRAVRPDLPVLYMSGYTEREPGLGDRLEAKELLRKPFNAAELAARVRAILP